MTLDCHIWKKMHNQQQTEYDYQLRSYKISHREIDELFGIAYFDVEFDKSHWLYA